MEESYEDSDSHTKKVKYKQNLILTSVNVKIRVDFSLRVIFS